MNRKHPTAAHELWPPDLHERASAVLEFIAGHVIVQDRLDDAPERELADWIAIITLDLGRACAAHAANPGHADSRRAAAAWLACAAADALRARLTFAPAERRQQLEQLHAHIVSVQMCEPAWRPAIQIAFVTATLGELAETAAPLMTADPDAHGPVPRFGLALRRVFGPPGHETSAGEAPEAEEPADPVRDTAWALEDVAQAAAGAAIQLHPGGTLGMPDDRP